MQVTFSGEVHEIQAFFSYMGVGSHSFGTPAPKAYPIPINAYAAEPEEAAPLSPPPPPPVAPAQEEPESAFEGVEIDEAPKRRGRRTKAEIEADEARSKAERNIHRARDIVQEIDAKKAEPVTFEAPPSGPSVTDEQAKQVLSKVLSLRGAAVAQGILKNAANGAMRWGDVKPEFRMQAYTALKEEAGKVDA